MNNLITVLILLAFVSCGKASKGSSDAVTCSSEASLMQDKWLNTFNGDKYDLTTCAVDTTCAVCGSYPACDGYDDFSLRYNDGYVTTQLYIQKTVKQGTWKVCGNEAVVSWSDGKEMILERL